MEHVVDVEAAMPVMRRAAADVDDAELIDIVRADLPRLQRLARLLVGDAHAADDLVAEALARTLPRWRAGRVDEPAAYLHRVVANLAARRWRRGALGRRRDHSAADWWRQPADGADAVVERERTLLALRALPPRRRAVVVLRFYDDLTEAQIAAVLGVGVGTVKSQLSRALDQLRVALDTVEDR